MKKIALLIGGITLLAWMVSYYPATNDAVASPDNKILQQQPTQTHSTTEVAIVAPQSKIIPRNLIKRCDQQLHQREPTNFTIEQEFIASLANSVIPEQQLAHILFDQFENQQLKHQALALFNRNYPNNPLVIFDLVGLCINNAAQPDCDDDLLAQAINVGNNDGSMWLQIANYHAARNDKAATTFAIRQIIAATYFTSFKTKSTELYLDISAGSTIKTFSERAINAIGYSAARAWYMEKVIKFCRQDPIVDHNKDLLCWQLGKTLEQRSSNSLLRAIGGALQQEVANIDQQMPPSTNKQYVSLNEQLSQAMSLAVFDQQLFREYLTNINLYNEQEAAQRLVEQAILKSKSPNYDPCSG